MIKARPPPSFTGLPDRNPALMSESPGTVRSMAYTATVLRAMIASPSDIPEARDAVEAAIHGWNDANSHSKGIVLLPWRWESSAVPVLGGHPQALINAQGVDDSDLVFALFGGRLGAPTPDAVSGTVEEIERAIAASKPVHLYFSTAPLPNDVDLEQVKGLRQFKEQIETRGLLGQFSNPSQLQHEVWKAIEHDITSGGFTVSAPALKSPGVDLVVQPKQERELKGVDSKGKSSYTTRHWLEVTNRGSVDAENVTFGSVGDDSGLILLGNSNPTVIHAGQTRRVSVAYTWGGGDASILKMHWMEGDQQKERDFHVD